MRLTGREISRPRAPSGRRAACAVGAWGVRAPGLPRSTQRKVRVLRADEAALTDAVVSLASQYDRYGYRRITALQRRIAGG